MPSPANPSSLFDDETDPAAKPAAASLARALMGGDATPAPTRWQREFAKASAAVTDLRRALEQATQLRDAYQVHASKVYEPRWKELVDARRDWVVTADRVLQEQSALPKSQRLSARRRKHLVGFVVLQIDSLLGSGSSQQDQDLAAIHDRHCEITLEQSVELEEAMTRSMLEDLVGPDIARGRDGEDIEALIHRAHEHIEAQNRERAEQRSADPRRAKARAKREQAAKAVSQSVREVYRKLASALHPDRETDPAERDRKTALMQRANQAYEQGDLLELLSMQIRLLEHDQGALARADDKRLQLYCQALKEQQDALRREIADVEAPVRMALELPPNQRLPDREAVLARIDRDAKRAKHDAKAIRTELPLLLDPRRCGALIDSLPMADIDDEMRMLEEAMLGVTGTGRTGRGRGR